MTRLCVLWDGFPQPHRHCPSCGDVVVGFDEEYVDPRLFLPRRE